MELLRFVVVLGAAAAVLTAGRQISGGSEVRLGALNRATLGLILGAGLGYVIGGILSRAAGQAMNRGERTLDRLTLDHVVAGTLSALVATALVGLISWPLLLLEPRALTASIVMCLLLSAALFDFGAGQHRRTAVITRLGGAAGLAAPPAAAPARPWIADTSVAIDVRIFDVVRAGFLNGRRLVPAPVLGELQGLAASAEDSRRDKECPA